MRPQFVMVITAGCVFSVGMGLMGEQTAASDRLADTPQPYEVSDDGRTTVILRDAESSATAAASTNGAAPFGAEPDWQNDIRRQVGQVQPADMNNNGLIDVVVGCYHSQSFPPYDDWHNMVYFNVGGELEASPSWISSDEVSTGDLKVADLTGNGYLDVIAANGGPAMAASVIYFNGPNGLSTTPGWSSNEPGGAWNNNVLPVDLTTDGFIDLVTANQGNSQFDPYRPMFAFYNTQGSVSTTPGWQSAETSIQNRLAAADFDNDGWQDVAVSKWANFESGIYRNDEGTLEANPMWTTGQTTTDRGAAAADVNNNGWFDVAFGTSPTSVYSNDEGDFTQTWSAIGDFFGHSEMLFRDITGNGYPDLTEIHFSSRRVNIYLNIDGELTQEAAWTWQAPGVGTAVGYGDITGNGLLDLVVGNAGEPSLSVFYAKVTPPDCPADFNNDEVVNVLDLLILLEAWGPCEECDEDLNNDGVVNVLDLLILLEEWGPCPSS